MKKTDEVPKVIIFDNEGDNTNVFPINKSQLVKTKTSDTLTVSIPKLGDVVLENRFEGCLRNHSIFLSDHCDWKIVKDDLGVLCLICIKKP
jgi:hypothetical protein